ncbi:hypothetical protein LEN26_001362 [Aphanomyces euteiches]|nr:hypothetical protein AeMF1_003841 [Aphanomyces euteiches]KAH9161540.1 hypothetical protein LEN26_001362 [Aphanomyces euteiches]KAH9187490.1 hypothetical protein AeNC1_010535 [Aphanomyces euteiches]
MAAKASWTDERTMLLLDCFSQELVRGKGTDAGGLKKEGRTRLLRVFNGRAATNYTKSQVQGRLSLLKAEYSRVHALRTNSGFGWDAASELPTAPDEVWEAYIAVNPKTAIHRPYIFYNQLHAIYSGAVATGEFASTHISSHLHESNLALDTATSDGEDESEPTSEVSVEPDRSVGAYIESPFGQKRQHVSQSDNDRKRRKNPVAESLIFLAQTQQGIQEGRFPKPPTTTERALVAFREMNLELTARQSLNFARYLAMTPSADVLFLNISVPSRLELVAEICEIDVADIHTLLS